MVNKLLVVVAFGEQQIQHMRNRLLAYGEFLFRHMGNKSSAYEELFNGYVFDIEKKLQAVTY